MLDHAARWETAQMLALRPRLVDVGALDGLPFTPKFTAVLGDDPRSATVKQGEAAVNLAVERISSSVLSLLEQQNADILHEFYSRRRAGYQNYVSRYFRGSWEQALASWWKEKND
jgi:creatinine amidohydrolase